MNLTHISRNLKCRKRNKKCPKESVIEINQYLQNKGALVPGDGLISYLAICLFKISFDVAALVTKA